MQRKDRSLDAETNHYEREPGLNCRVVAQRRETDRHVRHIERAGRAKEKADADHIEGRADRSHDEVVECRRKRAPVALLTCRDERVGSDR